MQPHHQAQGTLPDSHPSLCLLPAFLGLHALHACDPQRKGSTYGCLPSEGRLVWTASHSFRRPGPSRSTHDCLCFPSESFICIRSGLDCTPHRRRPRLTFLRRVLSHRQEPWLQLAPSGCPRANSTFRCGCRVFSRSQKAPRGQERRANRFCILCNVRFSSGSESGRGDSGGTEHRGSDTWTEVGDASTRRLTRLENAMGRHADFLPGQLCSRSSPETLRALGCQRGPCAWVPAPPRPRAASCQAVSTCSPRDGQTPRVLSFTLADFRNPLLQKRLLFSFFMFKLQTKIGNGPHHG